MIKKEIFINWINATHTQMKHNLAINEAFRNAGTDTYWMGTTSNELTVALNDIIEDVIGVEGIDIVNWWLYECGEDNSFGDNVTEPLIYDKDENIIADLTKVEDLYDWITKEEYS